VKSLYKMCVRHSLLPGSLQINVWYDSTTFPHSRGGFADVWKGKWLDQEVAIKVLRTHSKSDIQNIVRVSCLRPHDPMHSLTRERKPAQRFCKEFVTWKALNHPNVLPLLGVTMTEHRFVMVSEWMTNGNISQFVTTHRHVNRFKLVSSPSSDDPRLSLTVAWPT